MRPEEEVLSLIRVGDFTHEGKHRIVKELAGLPLSEAVSLLLFVPHPERMGMIEALCRLEKKEIWRKTNG